MERIRAGARTLATAAVRRVRSVRGREGAARGTAPTHAALGGARLRAGPQKEEDEGRQEEIRRPYRTAGQNRETVRAVGAPSRPRARTPKRRRRRASRASGRRTRFVPARPARPRARLGRPPGDSGSKRQRQDDLARGDPRTDSTCRRDPVDGARCRARRGRPAEERALARQAALDFHARGQAERRRRANAAGKVRPGRRPRSARSRSLSPGERTRALIALLAARGVNCLVLDEPTNHLDVAAIEELERALDSFEGTVMLVTHDRRFLAGFPRYADAGAAAPRASARPYLNSVQMRFPCRREDFALFACPLKGVEDTWVSESVFCSSRPARS